MSAESYPDTMSADVETSSRRTLRMVAFVAVGTAVAYVVLASGIPPVVVLVALVAHVGWAIASCTRFVRRERREATAVGR